MTAGWPLFAVAGAAVGSDAHPPGCREPAHQRAEVHPAGGTVLVRVAGDDALAYLEIIYP